MRDTQALAISAAIDKGCLNSGTGDPAAVNGTRMSGEVFAALECHRCWAHVHATRR